MISGAAVQHFTAGQLFEHLGVRLELISVLGMTVLEVRFASGCEAEHWMPAPDGYPLDGSREFIEFRGRYFVPDEAPL